MTNSEQSPADLRKFYEVGYERGFNIAGVLANDDFMYGQVLWQVRPYLRTGLEVLDLGCNNGALSLHMARHGGNVLGIDLARNIIETARKGAEHHGIDNARFEAMDFLNDWNAGNVFDLVLCSHVIEHVPDDQGFVNKIAMALKPHGVAVILVPSIYSSLYRANKMLRGGFKFDQEVGHLRRYSRQSLASVVQSSGLKAERVVFLDSIPREWVMLSPVLRWSQRIWCRRYLRSMFNRVDATMARAICPATVCIHARKPDDGSN